MRNPPYLIAALFASLLLNGVLLVKLDKPSGTKPLYLSETHKRARAQMEGEANRHVMAGRLAQNNKQHSLSLDDINLLFQGYDFEAAMSGYGWLLSQNKEQVKALKTTWLFALTKWLEQDKALDRVQAFLAVAMAAYPNDDEYLNLKVDFLLASDDVYAAIDLLYQRINDSDPSRQGKYVSRLQKLVKARVDYLAAQQAWQPLVTLTQKLLWHEPHYPPYGLIAGRAHIQLQQYSQAKSILQGIVFDAFYGGQAQQLLDKIALLDLQRTAVKLLPKRAHYLVDGKLNAKTPVRLMIDTGASLSVISAAVLKNLNVYPEPVFVRNAVINTAGGKVRAPIYRFASYQIKDYRVNDIEFVVMDLDSSNGSAGLLGMNFLKRFAFQIDQKNNLLILESN